MTIMQLIVELIECGELLTADRLCRQHIDSYLVKDSDGVVYLMKIRRNIDSLPAFNLSDLLPF